MDKRCFEIFEKISRQIRSDNADQWIILASPLAKLNHWQSLLASDLAQGKADTSSYLSIWIYKLYCAYQGFRFLLSRRSKMPDHIVKSHTLMLSIWIASSHRHFQDSGIDPIWGDFVNILSKSEQKPVIFYIDEHQKLDRAYRYKDIHAYSIHSFLTLWDYLVILYQMAFLKVTVSVSSYKKSTLKDIYQAFRAPIALAMAVERALTRIIQQTQCQKILLPFEGNSWESGALRAAQENQIYSFGYQHTALPDEMTKLMYDVHKDRLPDVVITSGAGAADRLKSYFQIPETRLISGVLFRKNISYSPSAYKKEGYVLILLQGLDSDQILLDGVSKALEPIDVPVKVRAHPACPVEIPTLFNMSKGSTLEADISGAGVCLYGGTSACIEAILSGVPVIHIDGGMYLSSDPLSFLPLTPLKQNWHSGLDLKEVIKNMRSIDIETRQELRDRATEHIRRMLTPPDSQNTEYLVQHIIQKTYAS